MERTFEQPRMTTGKIIEKELLGEIEATPKEKEILKETWRPFPVALADARRRQPWPDPTKPEKPFARDLRIRALEKIGLGEKHDDKLKFFTSVESTLDEFHSVDAWLELHGTKKGKFRITLDVTTDPDKEPDIHLKTWEDPKTMSDVVFLVPSEGLDPEVNEDEYNDVIEKVSDGVKEQIGLKYERRNKMQFGHSRSSVHKKRY